MYIHCTVELVFIEELSASTVAINWEKIDRWRLCTHMWLFRLLTQTKKQCLCCSKPLSSAMISLHFPSQQTVVRAVIIPSFCAVDKALLSSLRFVTGCERHVQWTKALHTNFTLTTFSKQQHQQQQQPGVVMSWRVFYQTIPKSLLHLLLLPIIKC